MYFYVDDNKEFLINQKDHLMKQKQPQPGTSDPTAKCQLNFPCEEETKAHQQVPRASSSSSQPDPPSPAAQSFEPFEPFEPFNKVAKKLLAPEDYIGCAGLQRCVGVQLVGHPHTLRYWVLSFK